MTTLESFRLFMQPDQEWMSEEDLLQTIRGELVPTYPMRLGRAFHAVLETPEKYRVQFPATGLGGYLCDDFLFSADMMQPALDLFDRRGVFEAKTTKQYGEATVVAKADYVLGAEIHESKTRLEGTDIEKYLHSCQWRFLLDLFGGCRVTYHVFLLGEDRGEFQLRDIETFRVYAYPELHQDCQELVRQFCDYARLRGLDELLRERNERPGVLFPN